MNIQELEDTYQILQRERKCLWVSPEAYGFIPDSMRHSFTVTIEISLLLPFETHWDACNVETHEEVKIPSGEWVHAIVIPAIPEFLDLEPLLLEIAPAIIEEDRQNAFLSKFVFKGRMF